MAVFAPGENYNPIVSSRAIDESFSRWIAKLQKRHLRSLTFSELRKGVQALSRIYVENRRALGKGAVFQGAAKRAAFACFYSPLHYLLVREVVLARRAEQNPPRRILDLGCGLGVAGAAWSVAAKRRPAILGIERNPWAAAEARHSLRELGVRAQVLETSVEAAPMPRGPEAVVAAFSVNELPDSVRRRLLDWMMTASRQGIAALVIEPIARQTSPWWEDWSESFRNLGGEDETWRFAVRLPEPLAELDHACGLDHRELTARSLFLPGAPSGSRRRNWEGRSL